MREPTFDERITGSPALGRRQAVARMLRSALGRYEAVGLANVPASGPLILAINHRSLLDGPLLFGAIGRPVNCLVKAEAFTSTMGGWLRSSGQIPVVRETIDPGPVRLCVRILRAGGVVGVFPEGTRGDGSVRTAKGGVGYFALRSGASVVPVACHGSFEAAHRRTIRRPELRLTFGPPITIERYTDDRPLNRRVVAATTESIRSVLAEIVAATAPAGVRQSEGLAA
jgi:1-acyl-sn-glycerol-3-phosphate acyltransferase